MGDSEEKEEEEGEEEKEEEGEGGGGGGEGEGRGVWEAVASPSLWGAAVDTDPTIQCKLIQSPLYNVTQNLVFLTNDAIAMVQYIYLTKMTVLTSFQDFIRY